MFLPDTLDERRAKGLAILAMTLRQRTDEATLRMACTRLEALLEKKYAAQFATWAPALANADGTLASEPFADLSEFLAALPKVSIAPPKPKPRARTRRETYVPLLTQ